MRRRWPIVIASTTLILIFVLLRHSQLKQRLPRQSRALYDTLSPKPSNSQDGGLAHDSEAASLSSEGPTYIFAFGDSYTSYGFDSNGSPPSTSNPIGNRLQTNENTTSSELATSTPKWLDFMISDFSPPSTLAYNYGRGASTIDEDVVAPIFWGAKSLVKQVREFLGTANNPRSPMHANWASDNNVFIVWFGINDVKNTAEEKDLDRDGVYLKAVQSYIRSLDILCAAGGRRFLIIGLPPIDRTPQFLLLGPPHTFDITTASHSFSKILEEHIKSWASVRPDIHARYFDIEPTFHRILSTNPSDAECTVEEKATCLWLDLLHPAERFQKAIGEEIGQALRGLGMWR